MTEGGANRVKPGVQIVREELLRLDAQGAVGGVAEHSRPHRFVHSHEGIGETAALRQQTGPFRDPIRVLRIEPIRRVHRAIELDDFVAVGEVRGNLHECAFEERPVFD